MDDPAPILTVVIPTYRRPQALHRALCGLARQQAPFTWRAVVVDNDSAGGARPVVDAAAAAGAPVDYLLEPRTGAAHARNRGIDQSVSEFVAFLDDDVVPEPGWLAALGAELAAGQADVVGGRVVLDPEPVRPPWFDEEALGGYLSRFDPGPTARAVEPADLLLSANLAAGRSWLRRVGGFDPAFGPRGGVQLVADDMHLIRELRRAGAVVRYRPDAVVVHELPAQRLTRRYLLRRAYLQGRSDWRLERTDHPERRFGALRVAAERDVQWLRAELAARRTEGWSRRSVRFHAGCDLVRFVGFAREALTPPGRR